MKVSLTLSPSQKASLGGVPVSKVNDPNAVKSDEIPPEPEARPTLITASRGRPKGKRSDPSFEQVTAYIKKETYRQTKVALLQGNDSRDFSQLVEELLCAYLRTHNCK